MNKLPKIKYVPWTTKERQILVWRKNSGATFKELAMDYGMTQSSIRMAYQRGQQSQKQSTERHIRKIVWDAYWIATQTD